eukprot:gene22209-biopygen4206
MWCSLGRRWTGRARWGDGGGGVYLSSHVFRRGRLNLARFSRVRAAMRIVPGAHNVGQVGIRMSAGSSPASQRLSRDTLKFTLSVRLAGTKKAREAPSENPTVEVGGASR